MKAVLVTGGAGYIGSHTLRALASRGYAPICIDNLSTGFREFVGDVPLIEGDLADPFALEEAFSRAPIAAVVHFASLALVEESVRNPARYYHDNILNCLNLLGAMRSHGVRYVVFSSTAATYGIPDLVPIAESTPLAPVNPYGVTKMVLEHMLADYAKAYGLRFVSLRYFNAAGAATDGTLGEWHTPETHLIPRLLDVACGRGKSAEIYGNDYPTLDGTCVRDYIHVSDLAVAHAAALDFLLAGNGSNTFNLGTGEGHTVLEVVREVARTTGADLPYEFKPRRPGDPPALIADPAKAQAILGWQAEHSNLGEIVETAWNWHRKRSGASQPRS